MLRRAEMANTYWTNKVVATGGVESTTNRLDQSQLQNAEWVLLGTRQGMFELFPERFEETTGVELERC